jgi:hypothetical protein
MFDKILSGKVYGLLFVLLLAAGLTACESEERVSSEEREECFAFAALCIGIANQSNDAALAGTCTNILPACLNSF